MHGSASFAAGGAAFIEVIDLKSGLRVAFIEVILVKFLSMVLVQDRPVAALMYLASFMADRMQRLFRSTGNSGLL